jgi:hypothetical protein
VDPSTTHKEAAKRKEFIFSFSFIFHKYFKFYKKKNGNLIYTSEQNTPKELQLKRESKKSTT